MRLVLGLGNPGDRYAGTRHNVAWRVLDTLAERWHGTGVSVGDVYTASRARVAGEWMDLVKPLTFMNLAGEALVRWVHENGDRGPEHLLVLSDDVYLPVGSLRLRRRGSSGGHRGLESVAGALNDSDFARLRLGVGAAESSAALREHVLENFSPEEQGQVAEMIERAADAVECWAADGIVAAMNRFNHKTGKEVSES